MPVAAIASFQATPHGDLEDELEAGFESSLAYDYPSVEVFLDYLQARGLLRPG